MNRTCTSLIGLCLVVAALAIIGGHLLGCRVPGKSAVSIGVTERTPPRPMDGPVRGVWVARFHYRYPNDVRTIMRKCAELGFNTVYWQVRGSGTVAYPSQLEPWPREFNHQDPGFDPLELAVEQAHANGLRIEAWVNVLPGWRGKQPPSMRQQLWNAHPQWFLQDAQGRRQALGDFYVIVNPCLPEVRRHIVQVIEEIAGRYDVDGIHLDYVRYAWETTPDAEKIYPRDERTLALYRRETQKHPDDDPRAWRDWRANQLTRLVAEIRTMLERRRPAATLTAAVARNPVAAYERFFQNGVTWLRTGLVDALMPMVYTDTLSDFETDVQAYRRLAGSRRIVPGVGVYKHHTDAQMRQQLARCAEWGGDCALFSFASLYPTHQDRQSKPGRGAVQDPHRVLRRTVMSQFVGQ